MTMTQDDDVRIEDHRVRAEVRRLGFFAALDSLTWHARSRVTTHLADVRATSSPAAYVGWLRRAGTAWAAVPLPVGRAAASAWPVAAVDPTCTGVRALLTADLRDHAPATRPGLVPTPSVPADDVRCAAAAYVVVATAHAVAPLAAPAGTLTGASEHLPAGTRYLRCCVDLDAVRDEVRHDLVSWADAAGPGAADRMIRTAGAFLDTLGTALAGGGRRGW
ncbi:MAG: hypothetical protein ACKVZ6_12985 [Kineosporiaceae bacterium]|jgi:hypothetical protein